MELHWCDVTSVLQKGAEDTDTEAERWGGGAREERRKGPCGEILMAFQGRGPGPRRASDLLSCSLPPALL